MSDSATGERSAIEQEAQRSFTERRPLLALLIGVEFVLIAGGVLLNALAGESTSSDPATLGIVAGLFGTTALVLGVLGAFGLISGRLIRR